MTSYAEMMKAYESIHQNRMNRFTHAVGIPIIMVGLVGLFMLVELNLRLVDISINGGWLLAGGTLAVTFRWSWRAGVAFLPLVVSTSAAAFYFSTSMPAVQSFYLFAVLFVVGWCVQFLGHAFEGKSPEFVARPQNLLLGPISVVLDAMPFLRPYPRGAVTGEPARAG